MAKGPSVQPHGPERRTLGGAVASFILSWGLAIFLIAALIHQAGVWNILANTRLLDVFIEGGIIRYHDLHLGIVDGVDQQETFLRSQDPIDYRLVLIAALVYFAYWGLKGIQYNAIARFCGLKGSMGRNLRAWLYGDGLGRFFPHRFGQAATSCALEAEGEDPVLVQKTFSVMRFLIIVFEIGLFWLFGLWVTSYPVWFAQSVAALLILGGAVLFARGTGLLDWGPGGFWKSQGQTFRALSNRPASFAKLGFMSSLAMLLDDLTPFIIAMAFTGDFVILSVPFFIIQSGVVAGYIAKRVSITPHGIGQWEWAFALALVASGVGLPEAATIALLDSALRHLTGFIVYLVVTVRYGVKTNFGAVLRRYIGAPAGSAPVGAGAPVEAAVHSSPDDQ